MSSRPRALPGPARGRGRATRATRALAAPALDAAPATEAVGSSAAAAAVSPESAERYRSLIHLLPDAVLVHVGGRIRFANAAAATLLGLADAGVLVGTRILDLVHPDDRRPASERIRALLDGGNDIARSETRLLRADGSIIHAEIAARPLRFDGAPAIQAVIRDVTRRRQVEDQLRHAALHDALTQLPNRGPFTERLTRVIERLSRRPDYRFAVLFVDLDRFKLVNDSLGHHVGDELLVAVARRLADAVRPEDTVARLGGDEFAILLVDLPSIADATLVANRIEDALKTPFHIFGHEIYATASVGIALSTTGYSSPEEVLRDADTAMYRAKGQDTEKCVVFNEEMHARAVALLEMDTALRRGMERGEFQLVYQPIIALDSRRVTGFEALLRWDHPDRGILQPGEFLAAAEETGLIAPLGRWILREACCAVRAWREQAPAGSEPIVSVNVSPRQLLLPSFAAAIRDILAETGLPGEALRLEVSESALLEHAGALQRTLRELKSLDVRLCVDDFGTGYSSLAHLRDLPVDMLKIDRASVPGPTGLADDRSVAAAVLALARQLDRGTIAKRVETELEAQDLAELGCAYAQGYLYSGPVDAEAAGFMLCGELGPRALEGAVG